MNVYYNDNEAFCAEWLRNLMAAGHLPAGDVDERDIREVDADDLKGYDQCHFFAGIGGWPHALNLAGWEGPVWTGSCPCQPLSSAGQRKGHADERHLWPAFHDLIAECSPPVVFGEQVASKDGREWLCGIRADLEQLGYAVGAADLPSAGVGAPHIRQRLWWVADSNSVLRERGQGQRRSSVCTTKESEGADAHAGGRRTFTDGGAADAQDTDRRTRERREKAGTGPDGERRRGLGERGRAGGLADAEHDGGRADLEGRQAQGRASDLRTGGGVAKPDEGRQPLKPTPRLHGQGTPGNDVDGCGGAGGLGDAGAEGLPPSECQAVEGEGRGDEGRAVAQSGSSFWTPFDLIPCTDGKARRVEPGVSPLAHGVRNRVGRLRAYGNAINPILAAEFVRAVMT